MGDDDVLQLPSEEWREYLKKVPKTKAKKLQKERRKVLSRGYSQTHRDKLSDTVHKLQRTNQELRLELRFCIERREELQKTADLLTKENAKLRYVRKKYRRVVSRIFYD